MATTSFAYNIGSVISGTTQVGDLAVGIPSSGYTSTPPFWEGPEESTGYVIAVPVSGNTQPTYLINPSSNLTLSTTYIGNDIGLSNGNQTASQQFGYQQTVLGNTIISPTSKVMFSVLVNLSAPATLPGSHVIGIGRTTMNYKSTPAYGAYPGNDSDSMGYCSDGTIFYQGAVYLGGLQTWTNNDVIDIVIDNNVNAMWVRVNGGYWNNNDGADPAANTGGMEIINGPFYPALCPGYEGSMTIQNSAEYGVPSGYTLLGSNETASVGFYKTTGLTDSSFIDLAQYVSIQYGSPQTFATALDASTWLTTNGFWNSYGLGFTISSSDFISGFSGNGVSGDNTTFSILNTYGSGEAFYGPNFGAGSGGSTAKADEINAYFIANGLSVNNNAYLFNATWAAGSTLTSGIVVATFYYFNVNNVYINLGIVDTTIPGWNTPGANIYTTLRAIPGTYNFPVTLSLYTPTIQDNDNWC